MMVDYDISRRGLYEGQHSNPLNPHLFSRLPVRNGSVRRPQILGARIHYPPSTYVVLIIAVACALSAKQRVVCAQHCASDQYFKTLVSGLLWMCACARASVCIALPQ
jgi:hypothetical protein